MQVPIEMEFLICNFHKSKINIIEKFKRWPKSMKSSKITAMNSHAVS